MLQRGFLSAVDGVSSASSSGIYFALHCIRMKLSSFIIPDPLSHGDWHCTVAFPDDDATDSAADMRCRRYPAVYLMGETDVEAVMSCCTNKNFILVGIEGKDWNSPFSPWPEPKLAKNLGPFAGGGSAFLEFVIDKIKPYVDSHFATIPDSEHTALAGYSLAGLLTAYAFASSLAGSHDTDNCSVGAVFSRFACMSGSLWFPGGVEFVEKVAGAADRAGVCTGEKDDGAGKCAALPVPRLYFSLGDREKVSKNALMAQVESCTQKTVKALERYKPVFEMNSGGHFDDVPARIAKGICAVMKACL